MYEILKLHLLRRSTLLITTGLILWLGVVTILQFFLPDEIFYEPGTDVSEVSLEIGTSSYYVKAGKTMIGLVGIILFIAGISIFIQDKRKGITSYFSVKNFPVDVKQQTIFVFIPGLDLYASFIIKKLTAYFLIIIAIGIPALILVSYMPNFSYKYLLVEGIVLPVAVYLIRRWSKNWNEQISNNVDNNQSDDISNNQL